jgi:BolA protein
MIRSRLNQAFAPTQLQIVDDSAKHAGHASAGGAGHFNILIVSTVFSEKGLLERHRMVYAAVADIMPQHIHALSINAKTPEEINTL